MPDTSQKTEKLLFGTLSVFLLALAFNFFTGEFRPTQSVSAKDGEQSGEPSEPSKKSEDTKSEDDDDEDSADDEDSVDDVSVKPAVESTAKPAVRPTAQTKPQEDSMDDVSVKSVDDTSVEEADEMSAASSDGDGDSEAAPGTYETVVQKAVVTEPKPQTVKVTRDEKLFFVLPVEVESEVVLDGQGAVVSERKDLINWLKSIFSL